MGSRIVSAIYTRLRPNLVAMYRFFIHSQISSKFPTVISKAQLIRWDESISNRKWPPKPIAQHLTHSMHNDAIAECDAMLQLNPNDVLLLLRMGQMITSSISEKAASPYVQRAIEQARNDDNAAMLVALFNRVNAAFSSCRSDIENFINPDIVLIQAPGWGVNTPPLGTAMLSSYARKKGYKVLPLDLNIELYLKRQKQFKNVWDLEQSLWFWETNECVDSILTAFEKEISEFIDIIISTNTPLVGFTIYNSSAYISLELAKMIKEKKPEIMVVFGGPHVSRDIIGTSIANNPFVDAVAQGEGELVLEEIISHIKSGKSLFDCSGIIVGKGDEVVDNGDAKLLKNMDDLPVPDFIDYAFECYRTPTRLPIISSRGCPNRCIYCGEKTFWKRFRAKSGEAIFREVQIQLKRYPFVNFFDFQDSLVNGKISNLEKFADLVIQSGIKISWSGQAVIRKEMTSELLHKLKQSGCICLAYGLEAPSEYLMKNIGKILSKGANVNAIAEAHRQTGLGVTYNFMFGLPGETEEDAFYAQEFLRRNKDSGMTVNPSSAFCFFFQGTPAYLNPQNYDINFDKGLLYWESNDGKNTYLTRLKRFEDFCRLVHELGISTTYPSTFLLDRNRSLGKYYAVTNDIERAKLYFEAWLEEHPDDSEIRIALNKLPKICAPDVNDVNNVFIPSNHTDENWLNGVAKSWASAFFIDDTSPYVQNVFQNGKLITFSNGVTRTIEEVKVDGNSLIIFLDGNPINGSEVGFPNEFKLHS